jgi:dipeptidyl aminopeptidase/acylaminoacyl peptidase
MEPHRDWKGIGHKDNAGYATLMGLTETPDLYACGVDIVGPTDLVTLIRTVPPYWKPDLALFRVRVGDDTTEAGRKFLEEHSPLPHADQIRRPLLIGEGANDPRVKIEQANELVAVMEHKHIPVTYVVFPDEGHGFARPVNRLAFYAVADTFLAEHLDGRYQPIDSALAGSTITVPAGARQVPGLETAMAEKKVASADK